MATSDNRSPSPLSGKSFEVDGTKAYTYVDPHHRAPWSNMDGSSWHSADSQNPFSATKNDGTDRATSAPYNQARQPINDAVTSAFTSTSSAISPELIQQITQNVIQQLQTHNLANSNIQQNHSGTGQGPELSSSATSPSIGRSHIYTPPTPHRSGEEFDIKRDSTSMLMDLEPLGRSQDQSTRRRDVSPFSEAGLRATPANKETTDSLPARPTQVKREPTDEGATVLEKIWCKMFADDGQPTTRLGQFLRGIAIHLIEDYEPKNSLVVTPDKLQRYYKDTQLKEQSEIYPWEVVFDDHTSSISRLFRELSIQHHLVQAHVDTRPDIPGLTPHGFATWMTLMLQAHPDQEFERLAITARDMPISNADDKKERFPKELSRRQYPTKSDRDTVIKIQKLIAQHCHVPVLSRQNSTTGPETTKPFAQREERIMPQSSPINLPRRDPDLSRVSTNQLDGDVSQASTSVNEFGTSDRSVPFVRPVPVRRRSVKVSDVQPGQSKSKTDDTETSSQAPSETSIEDESDVATPQPHFPIERERKPYVAAPGGGKLHDLDQSSSSHDEKTDKDTASGQSRRSNSISSTGRPYIPGVTVHQRNGQAPDVNELSRSKTASAYVPDHQEPQRARGNSIHSNDNDVRRARSNSMYHRDNYVHRNRSTSTSKGEPRFSAPDVSYGSSHTSFSLPSEYRASDRYDYRIHGSDGRENRYNERDAKPRYQPGVLDGHAPSEDYYRNTSATNAGHNGQSYPNVPSGYAQYPPNAYRDSR